MGLLGVIKKIKSDNPIVIIIKTTTTMERNKKRNPSFWKNDRSRFKLFKTEKNY